MTAVLRLRRLHNKRLERPARLNGDLLLWDDVLQRSIELSSMGIRVDKEALQRQLKEEHEEKRLELYFHKR